MRKAPITLTCSSDAPTISASTTSGTCSSGIFTFVSRAGSATAPISGKSVSSAVACDGSAACRNCLSNSDGDKSNTSSAPAESDSVAAFASSRLSRSNDSSGISVFCAANAVAWANASSGWPDSAARLSKSMPFISSAVGSTCAGFDATSERAASCGLSAVKKSSKSKSVSAVTADSAKGATGTEVSSAGSSNDPGSSTLATGKGGVAGTGDIKGSQRPSSRMASALARKVDAVHVPSRLAAMSSIHPEKAVSASAEKDLRSSLAGFWSASQLLKSCSTAHAASPNSFSPTMRELPLSV